MPGATRAVISLANLRANLKLFRSKIAKSKLCLAVKGNAYGHGLLALAQRLAEEVDAFAVATVREGCQLRQSGVQNPIYILSGQDSSEIEEILEHKLCPLVSQFELVAAYQRHAAARKCLLPLHLKVDTGMGRAGVLPEEALCCAQAIQQSPNLILQGLCTHFASADENTAEGRATTLGQLTVFEQVRRELAAHSIYPAILHTANSAAVLHYRESHYNMVRIGIGAYGYGSDPALLPVLSLYSKISIVKHLQTGQKVSYGGTWLAQRPTLAGVVSAGYADGYSRLLSNRGWVLVGEQLCPVIGRVCMDQFVIDLTDHPAAAQRLLGKDVLLFGDHPNLNAVTLAEQCGTICYEVLTSVAERVARVYV